MQKQTGVTEKRKWLFRLFFCCLIILSDPARIHQPDPVFFGSECFPEHCRYIAGWLSFDLVDEAVAQKENTFFLKHDATGKRNGNGAIFLDSDIMLTIRHYTVSRRRTCPELSTWGISKLPLRAGFFHTWPEEICKWDHLWGITWSIAIGSPDERRKALCRFF